MKKVILAISFLILALQCKAQVSTQYDTCSSLQQLEGEWVYQNGPEQIKVFLRYHRIFASVGDLGTISNRIDDRLIGWIEYKIGVNVIESTYQNRYMILDHDYFKIPRQSFSLMLSFRTLNNCNSQELIGYIKDFGHSGQSKNIDAILSNNNTVMHWTITHQEGYGAFNGDYGMTLPREFVLVKQ